MMLIKACLRFLLSETVLILSLREIVALCVHSNHPPRAVLFLFSVFISHVVGLISGSFTEWKNTNISDKLICFGSHIVSFFLRSEAQSMTWFYSLFSSQQ